MASSEIADNVCMSYYNNEQVAKLYRDVPTEQRDMLLQFRADHPLRKRTHGGVEWHYIDTKHGESVLLLLTGALGAAESSWDTILRFEPRIRVISPAYPAVSTMAELIDGIVMILEQEKIDNVHVLGGSYGGYVAQVFVRRHPHKVKSLVISHAGIPDVKRGVRISKTLRWLPLLPMKLLRMLFERSMSGLLPEEGSDTQLHIAFFKEVIRYQLTKDRLISSFRRIVDFDSNYVFSADDLREWDGVVLLVMADDDPGTPEPVRSAMQNLYPGARVKMFSGDGHAAPLLRSDEYHASIREFIADSEA